MTVGCWCSSTIASSRNNTAAYSSKACQTTDELRTCEWLSNFSVWETERGFTAMNALGLSWSIQLFRKYSRQGSGNSGAAMVFAQEIVILRSRTITRFIIDFTVSQSQLL